MNVVTLSGRAVKDVELRYTANGKPVASGTIAVQRKFKNAQGEYESDFLNFVQWGKGGEVLANHVKKGDFFGINGSIQTRHYDNNEGKRVYVTEIHVQDFDFPVRPKTPNTQQNAPQKPQWASDDPFKQGSMPMSNDDLPFDM